MKSTDSDNLRNIVLVGHGQSGKTSLVSAILYNTGMVNQRKLPFKLLLLMRFTTSIKLI